MAQYSQIALITGAARRVGSVIAKHLHQCGMRVIVHYRDSEREAINMTDKLNAERADSAATVYGDLRQFENYESVIADAVSKWGGLDAVVNNASAFQPTPVSEVQETQWNELMNVNLRAPFFLAQYAYPYLAERKGSIINISDTNVTRGLKRYSVYSMSKAGLNMMTIALAREFGPKVRVNAVAAGAILLPEGGNSIDNATQEKIISRTALKRMGAPKDVAEAVAFLINQEYISGQILAVDGGRF